MSLGNMVIFDETSYDVLQEMLPEKFAFFNAASAGGLIMTDGSNQGSFTHSTYFDLAPDFIRSRNPRGNAIIPSFGMNQSEINTVKVAKGTEEFIHDKTMFTWINQDPRLAAVYWA